MKKLWKKRKYSQLPLKSSGRDHIILGIVFSYKAKSKHFSLTTHPFLFLFCRKKILAVTPSISSPHLSPISVLPNCTTILLLLLFLGHSDFQIAKFNGHSVQLLCGLSAFHTLDHTPLLEALSPFGSVASHWPEGFFESPLDSPSSFRLLNVGVPQSSVLKPPFQVTLASPGDHTHVYYHLCANDT